MAQPVGLEPTTDRLPYLWLRKPGPSSIRVTAACALQPMNTCILCNKETLNPKFCSRSCSAKISNKISIKRKKTNKCKKCNCLIYSGITYCKSCYILKTNNLDITISKLIYSKHHRSSAFALIRSKARKVIKNLEKKCIKCGYNRHVEVCHIKPISSFKDTAKISEVNDINNLILLCPNCHWEFDNLNGALSN